MSVRSERENEYSKLPVEPATEPELDDFVSRQRNRGLKFVLSSGLSNAMMELKIELQRKTSEDPDGDPETDVYWGEPEVDNALKLNNKNSKMTLFEASLLDIYYLPHGLTEMSLQWNSLTNERDFNRVSVLINPANGDFLFQGKEKYLLEKSKWSDGFRGREAIDSLVAEISLHPLRLSDASNIQTSA